MYILRHKKKDATINCIQNLLDLKAERHRLKIVSSSLKEEYEQQDFLIRQRGMDIYTHTQNLSLFIKLNNSYMMFNDCSETFEKY